MAYAEHDAVRAALFDIDGTLTTGGDVWRPLLHAPQVKLWRKAWLYTAVLPHYMLVKARLADQATFRDRWIRVMAWLITGWQEEAYRALCQQILNESLLPMLRDDVVVILQQHVANGHHVVLVSTMFDGIVAAMAEHVGAHAGLGSRVEIRNGTCTGRIMGDTCSGVRKVTFARKYLAGLDPALDLNEDTAGYADSRSDLPLLASVRFPVTVYPDDELRASGVDLGWATFPE